MTSMQIRNKYIIKRQRYPSMDFRETQGAIKFAKTLFEQKLSDALHLEKVVSPIYIKDESYHDTLDGAQRPIKFDFKNGEHGMILHSLAKWKRAILSKYGYKDGEGIVTDMLAIRRDEDISRLHSYLVDQWDWEMTISKQKRDLHFLHEVVERIFGVLKEVENEVNARYPTLSKKLPSHITFITTQELENLYPEMTMDEREYAIVKKHKAVFISQIGGKLMSGKVHSVRAPDYDDWMLNGDILVYNAKMDCAEELSSMGIRVDAESLKEQLAKRSCDTITDYHRRIMQEEYVYSVGGGIGQSRVILFLLEKEHIGDVQADTEFNNSKN